MTEPYKPTPEEMAGLKIKPDQFKVSGDKVFFTVQGEGQSIGKPAVFLRLHFCNLQCSWCDTKYTWDKNSREFWQEGQDWTIEQAAQRVSAFPTKRLVVTGGEPMLQQGSIARLIEQIPDWDVEIETAGTVAPLPELQKRVQFNVSPKLVNSGNSLRSRYKPDVIRTFNVLPHTTFKFVVQQAGDLEEVDQIVEKCNLDPSKIIIMPEGTTQDEIRDHALLVTDQVKQRGWRLLPRLQIMLWGSERKV